MITDHVEITVSDFETSKNFYAKILTTSGY